MPKGLFVDQDVHAIVFSYCKVFCTLSGQNTVFGQNRRTWRRAESIGFGSPKWISNATLKRKSWPYLTGFWEQSSFLNGKILSIPFFACFTRKVSIFIQEQNHFSLMFPYWSFLNSHHILPQSFHMYLFNWKADSFLSVIEG